MRYSRGVAAGVLLGVALLVVGRSPVEAGKGTKLKILLVQGDATLWIDGKKIKGEGTEREMTAPELQKDKDHWVIKTMWEPNNYTKITRKMHVKPAEGEVVVDLTKANKKHLDDIVVRYVPTPDDIVEAMCKLGKVSKTDVVYDLGCGDGRMVIMAVEKFGAKRGVGIDLNPKLVKECEENAEKHGVSDKVKFRVGDVLKVKDMADADVVLLYMGDDINKRLKPILKKTLKAGSRVVSHRFLMGDDWKPTKTETVTGRGGGEYQLHLWVIGKKEE